MARWKALDLAPALVEKAKGLWDKVSGRAPAAPPTSAQEGAPPEVRILILEHRVARLEEEAKASFEVVGSIAQQHSQLTEQHLEVVQAADRLEARSRLLAWICGALTLALAALLAYVLLK